MSPQQVIEALKTVRYPGIDRDIVTLGYVKDVREDHGTFHVDLEFSATAAPKADEIVASVRSALESKGFAHQLHVTSAQASAKGASTPSQDSGTDASHDPLPDIPFKIAVSSGKGGVGKSTVAVNLAIALAQQGEKVGLLDIDIYGPSIPIMLGLEDAEPHIDQDRQKILTMERYGVRNISIGYMVDRYTPVIWRGPMVTKAIDQLIRDVDWSGVEILIFDLPPGTGDIQISLAQRVRLTGALVVTTPQDVALIDAGKGVAMFEKVNVPILGILENMSYFACPHCGERSEIFRAGGGEREATRTGVPFLGGIPLEPAVALGGDSGAPVVISAPESDAAMRFVEVARRLMQSVRQPTR